MWMCVCAVGVYCVCVYVCGCVCVSVVCVCRGKGSAYTWWPCLLCVSVEWFGCWCLFTTHARACVFASLCAHTCFPHDSSLYPAGFCFFCITVLPNVATTVSSQRQTATHPTRTDQWTRTTSTQRCRVLWGGPTCMRTLVVVCLLPCMTCRYVVVPVWCFWFCCVWWLFETG